MGTRACGGCGGCGRCCGLCGWDELLTFLGIGRPTQVSLNHFIADSSDAISVPMIVVWLCRVRFRVCSAQMTNEHIASVLVFSHGGAHDKTSVRSRLGAQIRISECLEVGEIGTRRGGRGQWGWCVVSVRGLDARQALLGEFIESLHCPRCSEALFTKRQCRRRRGFLPLKLRACGAAVH